MSGASFRAGGRYTAPWLVTLWLVTQGGAGCAQAVSDEVMPGNTAGASGGSGGDTSSSGGEQTSAGGGMAPSGKAGSATTEAGTTGNEAGSSSAGTGGVGGGSAGSGGAGGTSGGNAGAGGVAGSAGTGGNGGTGGAPDQCPNDPQKTAPGKCGCGVSEVCAELESALAHRYSFSSNNMTATDSVGNAHGNIVGVSASGGKVTFNGTDDAYVNLPNGMVSSLTNASFEVWLNWGGGGVWQRVFDFGTNDQGEDQRGNGQSYVFLTPSDNDAGNLLRASFTINGSGNETTVRGAAPLPSGSTQHIVLVMDDQNNQMRLYLNGTQAGSVAWTGALSGITDNNNWVGRSNWNDPALKGSIDELRIYKTALTAAQVAASEDFGPDPAFLN